MQEIYIVQQGDSDYDDNYFYLRSAELGKIEGVFFEEKLAKELQTKLIQTAYDSFKNRIDTVSLEDYFTDYKYPNDVEDYEKLHILLTQVLPEHIGILTYKVDDSNYVHPDNKSSLKKYCSWNTMDAHEVNVNSNYVPINEDESEQYQSILEDVMDIAEDRFDASYGLSWDHIDLAWQEHLDRNK